MSTTPAMRLAGESAKSLPKRMKFTIKALAAIQAPSDPKGRRWVYDGEKRGLAMLVTGKGARSFYHCRRAGGKPERARLGTVGEMTIEQAREEIDRRNGEQASGRNPFEARRQERRAGTLGELWTAYLTEHLQPRATAKTLVTDTSRYETCLEKWAGRRVLDITPADVRRLHAELGTERGHTSANRAIQLLRRLYGFARLGYNPVGRREINWFRETSRERFLSPDELRRFLAAMDDPDINQDIADIVRLSLFSGARRANVQAARAAEFDLDAATWTVPPSKSKNGRALVLPLVPQAAEIVKRRAGHESGFLFPSYGAAGHITEIKSTWQKLLTLAGLQDVRFHDCRRTFASWMTAGGASLQVVGKALGHHHLEATQVYSRLDLSGVRPAATAAVAAMMNAAGKAKVKK